jgi:hypothetical protein
VTLAVSAMIALAVAPTHATAATTLGQTFAPTQLCGEASTLLQGAVPVGSTYAAPADGVITSWRHQTSDEAVSIKLKVFRPVGPTTFMTVGESALTQIAANSQPGHSVRIPVRAGDTIGMKGESADDLFRCLQPASSFTLWVLGSDLPAGQSGDYTSVASMQLDLAATLEPDADGDGFGDETQDGCSTDGTTQATCAPPETSITKAPKKKTSMRDAKFQFTSSSPGAGFECALDGSQFAPCTSPYIRKVKRGAHAFQVRSTSAGQVDPTPAKHQWKVKKKRKRR